VVVVVVVFDVVIVTVIVVDVDVVDVNVVVFDVVCVDVMVVVVEVVVVVVEVVVVVVGRAGKENPCCNRLAPPRLALGSSAFSRSILAPDAPSCATPSSSSSTLSASSRRPEAKGAMCS